jgi:hypothetical protein
MCYFADVFTVDKEVDAMFCETTKYVFTPVSAVRQAITCQNLVLKTKFKLFERF